MRLLMLGDLSSPHTTRWAEALSCDHEVLVAGFGSYEGQARHESLGASPARPREFAAAIPRVRRIAERFAADVVHAHYVSSYGVLGDLATAAAPVVQFVWGSDVLGVSSQSRLQRRLTRRGLVRAALVVADSHEIIELVRSLAPGVPTALAVFGPPRSWTLAPKQAGEIILSPRLLRPVYNIDSILDAFTIVRPRLPGWSLEVLVGGGDPLGLTRPERDGARYLPQLSVADLQAAYLRASVACSVPSSDGTSVSLLEAMASGCLPVVSDIPSNREWVDHEVNGLVVPVRDTAALADALIRGATDVALRERAVQVNRSLIQGEATWEASVDRVCKLSIGLRRD